MYIVFYLICELSDFNTVFYYHILSLCKQDGRFTYIVTLRCVSAKTVAVGNQ